MYAATRGPNVKWGGTDFKWGGRAPLDRPLATALLLLRGFGAAGFTAPSNCRWQDSYCLDQPVVLKKRFGQVNSTVTQGATAGSMKRPPQSDWCSELGNIWRPGELSGASAPRAYSGKAAFSLVFAVFTSLSRLSRQRCLWVARINEAH